MWLNDACWRGVGGEASDAKEGCEEEEEGWTKLRFHAATLHMMALQTTKNAVHIPSHSRMRSIISTWIQNM